MRFSKLVRRLLGSSHAARSALWLGLLLVLPGGAQNNPPPHALPQPIGQRAGDSIFGPGSDPAEKQEREMALNRLRQKALVSDTEKLLRLANELDAEVRQSNPDSLTPAQLRKIAEIEKLARQVKDKMTFSVHGPEFYSEPLPYQSR